MCANNKGQQGRSFRQFSTVSATSGAGRYKFNGVLVDLKALIESLVSQGEEMQISKATLHVTLRDTVGAWGTIAAVVSDQAIAGADPGDNNQYGILDDLIDVMTAGDWEMKALTSYHLTEKPASGVFTWSRLIDFTTFAQQAARMLARRAVLATDPFFGIVHVGMAATANTPPTSILCWVECQYRVVQKPLRML